MRTVGIKQCRDQATTLMKLGETIHIKRYRKPVGASTVSQPTSAMWPIGSGYRYRTARFEGRVGATAPQQSAKHGTRRTTLGSPCSL